MEFIKIALIATAVFFAIDIIWLSIIAKKFYRQELKDNLSEKVNWVAAILFYIIFILGLSFFVIEPAVTKLSIEYTIFAGAFFGLVCYATYDLTNLATFKNWSLKLTIVDLIWGSVLSAMVSAITYYLFLL